MTNVRSHLFTPYAAIPPIDRKLRERSAEAVNDYHSSMPQARSVKCTITQARAGYGVPAAAGAVAGAVAAAAAGAGTPAAGAAIATDSSTLKA